MELDTVKKFEKKCYNLLYNKKYSKGSLYGSGIFPFWLYIAYVGKPLYKFSRRKIGLNKYFSLMVANILGSLFHVSFFYYGINLQNVILFIISLILFGGIFLLIHKLHKYSTI